MKKQLFQSFSAKNKSIFFSKTIFILLFFVWNVALLNSQNLHWARQMAKSGSVNYGNWGRSIAVDQNYNVYTVGDFEGTVDFDPGAPVYNLSATSAGGGKDIFISKLDSSGNFVWAINMGGSGYNQGYDIALDNAGNCYITGMHDDTTDFDPGPGVTNLIGFMDPYVAKYDVNGGLVWVKEFIGPYDDYGFSIHVSDSNFVYVTGNFGSTMDFDPGPGVANLTSSANKNTYILKLNSNGIYQWSKMFYCDLNVIGTSIDTDPTGKVYVGGFFYGTADFDPGPATYNLTSLNSRFVSKLDNAGNFIWANHVEGDLSNPLTDYPSLSVDNDGNVYSAWQFTGTADFDPGVGVVNLTSSGNTDIYILKQDFNGKYDWAVSFGKSSADAAASIYSDGAGLIYTTGYSVGTVDFDPGAGIININSPQSSVFVSVLDSSGNFYWAGNDAGGNSTGYGITADDAGKMYVTGHFWGTCDFDPGTITTSLTYSGSVGELFVQKLRYLPGLGIENESENLKVNIYPNPTTEMIIIDFFSGSNEIATIDIYNVWGQLLLKSSHVNSNQAIFDFSNFTPGVYLVKVNLEGYSKTWRVFKQ